MDQEDWGPLSLPRPLTLLTESWEVDFGQRQGLDSPVAFGIGRIEHTHVPSSLCGSGLALCKDDYKKCIIAPAWHLCIVSAWEAQLDKKVPG